MKDSVEWLRCCKSPTKQLNHARSLVSLFAWNSERPDPFGPREALLPFGVSRENNRRDHGS